MCAACSHTPSVGPLAGGLAVALQAAAADQHGSNMVQPQIWFLGRLHAAAKVCSAATCQQPDAILVSRRALLLFN